MCAQCKYIESDWPDWYRDWPNPKSGTVLAERLGRRVIFAASTPWICRSIRARPESPAYCAIGSTSVRLTQNADRAICRLARIRERSKNAYLAFVLSFRTRAFLNSGGDW